MMIIHHDRVYSPPYVFYYCGKQMIKGEEYTPFESEQKAGRSRHCLRCLYSKQRKMGREYMKSHGYPRVVRSLGSETGTGTLRLEEETLS